MPRVRGGCGIITTDCRLHVRETDRSGQAAVADCLEFPVPVYRRHPDLEEDRGRYDPSHPADWQGDVTDGRRVLAGWPRLDQHDARFWQVETRESFESTGCGRGCGRSRS